MGIYYDISEQGTNLPLDVIKYGKSCSFLEKHTGADIMVSPLGIPCVTETLLFRHIEAGAFLIQRKSGLDLVNSLGERLNEAIARMVETSTISSSQRILLYTGDFSDAGDDTLTLNGKRLNVSYGAFSKALDWWQRRGGDVKNLPTDEHILPWLRSIEADFNIFKKSPQKDVYPTRYYPTDPPASDDILQLPVAVRDWRITLATFPGIGADKCNALYKKMLEIYGNPGTLWMALHYAIQNESNIPGWGNETKAKARRWLGIAQDTDFYFGYQLMPPVEKSGSNLVEYDYPIKLEPKINNAEIEFYKADARKNAAIARTFAPLEGQYGIRMKEKVEELEKWYDAHQVGDVFREELEKGKTE